MVSHSVDPSCLLNICMPANTSTDSRLDRTKEVPVFTAAMQESILAFPTLAYIKIQYNRKNKHTLLKRTNIPNFGIILLLHDSEV